MIKKIAPWVVALLSLLVHFLTGEVPEPVVKREFNGRIVYRDTCLRTAVQAPPPKKISKRPVKRPTQDVSVPPIVDTVTVTEYVLSPDTLGEAHVMIVEVPKIIVMQSPPTVARERKNTLYLTGGIQSDKNWSGGVRLKTKSDILLGLNYTPNTKVVGFDLSLPIFHFKKDKLLK